MLLLLGSRFAFIAVLKLGFRLLISIELRQKLYAILSFCFIAFDLSVSINMPLMFISLDSHKCCELFFFLYSSSSFLVYVFRRSSSSRMHGDWISCAKYIYKHTHTHPQFSSIRNFIAIVCLEYDMIANWIALECEQEPKLFRLVCAHSFDFIFLFFSFFMIDWNIGAIFITESHKKAMCVAVYGSFSLCV